MAFPSEPFDVAVSSCYIHLLDDIGRYLEDIKRALKPGGKLALVVQSPKMYGDLVLVLGRVAKEYPRFYEYSSLNELTQYTIHTKEEIMQTLTAKGFDARSGAKLRFRERLTPELYAKHLAVMAEDRYLDLVPSNLHDDVRRAFMHKAAKLGGSSSGVWGNAPQWFLPQEALERCRHP